MSGSHYHCAEDEASGGYGCHCADLYQRGMDLLGLTGVGFTVSFKVESREPITLDEFSCPLSDGGKHTSCNWLVTRDPSAYRMFLRHEGCGTSWLLMTNVERLLPDQWWRPYCEQMAAMVHEIDRCSREAWKAAQWIAREEPDVTPA